MSEAATVSVEDVRRMQEAKIKRPISDSYCIPSDPSLGDMAMN